jgi:hypothetical protein
VYLQFRASLHIDNHIEELSRPGHKPLLLIDGELESEEDRTFLHELYEEISPPKGYLRLDNADHYANVAGFRALVVYDRKVLSQLVEGIDSWLKEEPEMSERKSSPSP